MSLLWIHDLPVFWSFLLVTASITLFSVGGIFIMKPFVTKWWQGHDNNDQIAFYLSAIGVFYGITLGLFAAGVWHGFEDSEDNVVAESSAMAALYRDVRSFPSPKSERLAGILKIYTYTVIHHDWPLHRKGIAETKGTTILNSFQNELHSFEPGSNRETGLFQEALNQFNRLSELRRHRLSSVTNGMSATIWFIIIIGAVITLVVCWLFNIPSLRLHIILNGLIGLTISTLIYLTLMLDCPFRGSLSIRPDAYQQVYDQLMK